MHLWVASVLAVWVAVFGFWFAMFVGGLFAVLCCWLELRLLCCDTIVLDDCWGLLCDGVILAYCVCLGLRSGVVFACICGWCYVIVVLVVVVGI